MGSCPKVIYQDGNETKTIELYSDEGFDLIGDLWLKLYTQYKLTHEITWLGVPLIQVPGDAIMMQELIWKLRPDVVIECGLAHGGGAIFYASIMELIGHGQVIGVDIDIRQYNKIVIQNHPLTHRIKMIEGSSISQEVFDRIKRMTEGARKVMAVLDSNHSKEHVAKEIELYSSLVTPGSYLVVMDGAQAFVHDIPIGKHEWKEDNPLIAIEEFMEKNDDFTIDPHYTRLKITANPKGFLRKMTTEEKKGVIA